MNKNDIDDFDKLVEEEKSWQCHFVYQNVDLCSHMIIDPNNPVQCYDCSTKSTYVPFSGQLSFPYGSTFRFPINFKGWGEKYYIVKELQSTSQKNGFNIIVRTSDKTKGSVYFKYSCGVDNSSVYNGTFTGNKLSADDIKL